MQVSSIRFYPQEVGMAHFEFYNPTKLIFGRGQIKRIGAEIKSFGVNKVIMIAGKASIKENGVYNLATKSLKAAGVEWKESWGVRPNPVLSKVRDIIEEAREFGAEAVLSIGGGSVIDSGKAVAAGCMTEDVWELYESKTPVTEAIPLFTILTISATGSEMNPYTVLTNDDEKKKWAVGGPALFPKVSIVDPSVQTGLPWNQTVNGAVDALSHIMEFYFMKSSIETTLAFNESIYRTIIDVTDKLKDDPKNYDLRASFAWAATLALNGTCSAGHGFGDWGVHSIEHGVSAVFPEVAHGAGLGVIYPAWLKYCYSIF